MIPQWRDAPPLARRTALVGLVGILVCAIGGVLDPAAFFGAWLATWLFLVGIALAGMMFVMIHELTGGRWGLVLRTPLEAAMLSLPLCALLALPLAFGMPALFEWARPAVMAASDTLQQKAWFLNVPGFLVRNAAWLAIWIALALALARRLGSDAAADARARRRISVIGLLVYLVTVTLFAYDWVASLVPDWNSTAVGLRLGSAQFVAAVAFTVAYAAIDARAGPRPTAPGARDLGDFGNLLLTVCMFWAYIAFTQFFIVWSEDLPHDTAWYWPRLETSWRWLAVAVLVLEFALPFVAMLFRPVKRNRLALALVCLVALAGQWLDNVWLTLPSLRPAGFALHWLDFAALLAEGGLWLALVATIVQRLPTPAASPRIDPAHAHG